MRTTIISTIVGVILGLAVGYIAHAPTMSGNQFSAGAVGDTQSTPKMAQIQGNEASNSTYDATNNQYVTVSQLNSNANDRVINSIDLFYQGLGTVSTTTAAKTITCATSSTATTLGTNVSYVLNTTVATSSSVLYVSTSTPGLIGTSANRIWNAGSYLNCSTNATSSATMIFKATYLQE